MKAPEITEECQQLRPKLWVGEWRVILNNQCALVGSFCYADRRGLEETGLFVLTMRVVDQDVFVRCHRNFF